MSDSNSKSVLVWDAPVRVFHWVMVLAFVGAFITADGERWRLAHLTLGYTMLGLVAFRVVWGLIGTRHARFASFVRGPRAVAAYLASILRGRPAHHVGHNPAGAVVIVLLLALTCITAASGWATYHEIGGHWMEDLHEGVANTMLAFVVVHVLGVLASSWLHRENLVRAMVSGRKAGSPDDAIRSAWRPLAVIILVAVPTFWWLHWQSAAKESAAPHAVVSVKHHED
jgi:cytochrome b